MRIALAQINPAVGDAPGNARRVIARIAEAKAQGASLVVFPELVLSGYPPEDLLFHRGFRRRIDEALASVAAAAQGIAVLVGYPEYTVSTIYNTAAWLEGGAVRARYRKQRLPNYQVFDEKRYFTPGSEAIVVDAGELRIGILICEDIWHVQPAAALRAAGADLCVALNASPYQLGKQPEREAAIAKRVQETGMPFAYVNLFGGQDELVFDGHSFVVDAAGRIVHRAPAFEESLSCVDADIVEKGVEVRPESLDRKSVV